MIYYTVEVEEMAKIMIVEDNKGTNKAICEYMKTAGHTLVSAYNGADALKHFRETRFVKGFTLLLFFLTLRRLQMIP